MHHSNDDILTTEISEHILALKPRSLSGHPDDIKYNKNTTSFVQGEFYVDSMSYDEGGLTRQY